VARRASTGAIARYRAAVWRKRSARDRFVFLRREQPDPLSWPTSRSARA